MKINLQSIHKFLIGTAISLLAAFGSVGMSSSGGLFGGMGQDASLYPILIGMLLWGGQIVFLRKKVYIPQSSSFLLLLSFIIVIFISGFSNIDELYAYTFIGNSAMSRYIIQGGTIVLYCTGALYFYNIFKMFEGDIIEYLFKYVVLSFIIAGIYSFIEMGSMLDSSLQQLLLSTDQVFRGSDTAFTYGFRIRSLAYEASMFGTYMSLAFPILLYFSMKEKKFSFFTVLLIYSIMLLLFSFSRTSYFICFGEFIWMLFTFKKEFLQYYWKRLIGIIVLIIIIFLFIYNTFDQIASSINIMDVVTSLIESDGTGRDTSNLTRYGSVVGAFNMFLAHPFFGIGWGTGSYHLNDFYPSWAWLSPEVSIEFVNNPVIFGIYARILAELGAVGLLIWLGCWSVVLRGFHKLYKIDKDRNEYPVLLVCLLGILFSGFNMDIFHFWGYWIILGVFWASQEKLLD